MSFLISSFIFQVMRATWMQSGGMLESEFPAKFLYQNEGTVLQDFPLRKLQSSSKDLPT